MGENPKVYSVVLFVLSFKGQTKFNFPSTYLDTIFYYQVSSLV